MNAQPSDFECGRDAGIVRAVEWLLGDYEYGAAPDWRQRAADEVLDSYRAERECGLPDEAHSGLTEGS